MLGEGIEKKEADLSADIEEQKKSFEEAAANKAAAAAQTQEAPAAEAAAPTEAKPTVQVSSPSCQQITLLPSDARLLLCTCSVCSGPISEPNVQHCIRMRLL